MIGTAPEHSKNTAASMIVREERKCNKLSINEYLGYSKRLSSSMARRAFAWLAAAVFSAANAPAYAGTRVVKTRSGPIRGKVHGSGISSFIGVPFAASTGGANRFEAPQARTPWGDTLNCTASSATYCPQADGDAGREGEDCLSLSIWTPSAPPEIPSPTSTLLPVLVWIYGGGFAEG